MQNYYLKTTIYYNLLNLAQLKYTVVEIEEAGVDDV